MKQRHFDLIDKVENLLALCNEIDPEEAKRFKTLKKYLLDMNRTFGQTYVDKFQQVRRTEAETKVVTSVAIHEHNQQFIEELQAAAKKHCFNLSKENIINIALISLEERYINTERDVEELVDQFY